MITTKEDFRNQEKSRIFLWSLSGQKVAELKGFRKPAFSPDGKQLAVLKSTPEGTAVRIYPVDGLLNRYPIADVLPSLSTNRLFPDEDLNQLIKQGCTWLYAYLVSSPNATESDRQMCGIPKRQ